MPLKKEHKENRRKKEEGYHQMWIDLKPVYNILENQTIFVRLKAPPAEATYSMNYLRKLQQKIKAKI